MKRPELFILILLNSICLGTMLYYGWKSISGLDIVDWVFIIIFGIFTIVSLLLLLDFLNKNKK